MTLSRSGDDAFIPPLIVVSFPANCHKFMRKIYYYTRALWLCANICDLNPFHFRKKYIIEKDPYVMTILTAWEVAKGIWLE